jgi:hypothetical protein
MIRRILLLNAGLLILLGFGVVKLRQDWNLFNSTHQVSAIKPRNETLPGLPVGTVSSQLTADWNSIPSRNPFSFDRQDITLVAPADPAPPQKPLGPKPVLLGVMNIGASRLAVLASSQGGGAHNSRTVRIGESVDGWTVMEIEDKSLIVEGNAARETIVMNEPSSQVQRERTQGSGANSVPAVQNVGQAASTPAKPAATPATTAPSQSTPDGQVQPDGSRIIQTPFGPHRIPKDPPEK